MKIRKNKFVLFILFIVIGLVLFACSNNEGSSKEDDEQSKNEESDGEKVELRVVSMFGGTDPSTDLFQEKLDEFVDANPNVEITNESLTADGTTLRTKVNTDFSSGNAPDVTFFFTGADVQPLVDEGLVVPLDEFLEADQDWKSGFSQPALDQMREEDGKLYAIPVTGFYEGLIVNKKLFDEQGLELPTDWDKLETAIQTFAENGIIPFGASLDISHYLVEHYILASGGPDGHNAGLTDGIHESWESGLNMIKKHYEMQAFPMDAFTIDDAMAQNLYAQEQAAMMINGSWAIGGLPEEVAENTVVLPFPVMPEGKATYGDLVAGYTTGYYLSKKAYDDASKKDIAMSLIKFLTSKETIKEFAAANGGVPAANVEVDGLSKAALSGHKMTQEANSLSLPIDSQISGEAFTQIRANVPQIVADKKSANEILEEAKKIEDSK